MTLPPAKIEGRLSSLSTAKRGNTPVTIHLPHHLPAPDSEKATGGPRDQRPQNTNYRETDTPYRTMCVSNHHGL
ncbi:hypothetical protein PISMIDRAFT_687719 [Pisolithus microcarpus 441]|uniref:Uncharacterized protein n=1 Tax=Pisolithus microcarpus 441 TaxID=765257 RepID=A0A0C9YDH0_9AGAM|nr:hypothetical protein PISMIDRAFT_687719 [Pisolithus microcarpus 441]